MVTMVMNSPSSRSLVGKGSGLDIPREDAVFKRRLRRILYPAVIIVSIVLIRAGVSRLEPAAPIVARGTVWTDTVKRGSMLRRVRGLGYLVPEEIRWIPAATDGRVERILVLPGAPVNKETILVELSNPKLNLAALEAEFRLKAAEAEYTDLKVTLESERLDQLAATARLKAEHRQARLKADRDEMLAEEGLAPDLAVQLSRVVADELANRVVLEEKRLEISDESVEAQLAAQLVRVEELRAVHRLKLRQLASLRVRADMQGVLQELPIEVGQQVTPGTNLARVSDPSRLKAEIKIAETRAKDIQYGMPASIDTRNGVIRGSVARIDPAAQNGTVAVDVKLEGPLPRGARPDLNVDGIIELERLENVLYVDRPAIGHEKSVVTLFKLARETGEAIRISVKLGRSSVDKIEIREGLDIEDEVILSDMSAWDGYDRIRLD